MLQFFKKEKFSDFCIEFFIVKFLWIFLIVPSQNIQFLIICFIILINFKKFKKIDLDKDNQLFLLWCIIYFVSLILNMFNHNLKDIISTLMKIGNFSFAVCLYTELANCKLDTKKLFKYFIIDIIIFTICLVAYIFDINKGTELLIFGRKLGSSALVGKIREYRFTAFLEYATLIGTVIVMLLPLITIFKNKFISIIAIAAMSVAVYLSKSRISTLVVMMFLSAYTLELIYFKIRLEYRKKVMFISIVVLMIATLIMHKQIYDIVLRVFNGRPSSNHDRFYLYGRTFEATVNNNIMLGNAVRVKEVVTKLFYGSHSTYLSFFYRTGLIGLLIGLVGFIQLFIRTIKNNKYKFTMIVYILGLSLFMVFEEIDSQYYSTILFFSVFGILNNKSKKLNIA